MTLGLNTTLSGFLDPMIQNGVVLKAMQGWEQFLQPWLCYHSWPPRA